jgi:hypothetical protein
MPAWLKAGLIVEDAIRSQEHRIEKFLGQGGFGAAYQAHRLSGENSAPRLCVLRVTIDAATWHSEAYFGHLLRHVQAPVEVYDSFAWVPVAAGCLSTACTPEKVALRRQRRVRPLFWRW